MSVTCGGEVDVVFRFIACTVVTRSYSLRGHGRWFHLQTIITISSNNFSVLFLKRHRWFSDLLLRLFQWKAVVSLQQKPNIAFQGKTLMNHLDLLGQSCSDYLQLGRCFLQMPSSHCNDFTQNNCFLVRSAKPHKLTKAVVQTVCPAVYLVNSRFQADILQTHWS